MIVSLENSREIVNLNSCEREIPRKKKYVRDKSDYSDEELEEMLNPKKMWLDICSRPREERIRQLDHIALSRRD